MNGIAKSPVQVLVRIYKKKLGTFFLTIANLGITYLKYFVWNYSKASIDLCTVQYSGVYS